MMDSNIFTINVGPLTGLGSFCLHTREKLHMFGKICRMGRIPEVEWDLTNVRSPHMSMAGLTTFLSIAHRMRQFIGHAQPARVRWDPRVFGFWHDISFFGTTREYDLLKWPEGMIGGFVPGKTNPNTKILVFPFMGLPDITDSATLQDWKAQVRRDVHKELLIRCGRLFESGRDIYEPSVKLKNQLAITSAELVVNCLVHGRAHAFVGLQRTRAGITVSVCDAGRGFRQSIAETLSRLNLECRQIKDELVAVLLGSLLNIHEMGLRRAIDTVVRAGGHIVISSVDAEIRWELPLWESVVSATLTDENGVIDISEVRDAIGEPVTGPLSVKEYREGYCRTWDRGVRGSRIAFEIVFKGRLEESQQGILR